jgi:hypothetical protein
MWQKGWAFDETFCRGLNPGKFFERINKMAHVVFSIVWKWSGEPYGWERFNPLNGKARKDTATVYATRRAAQAVLREMRKQKPRTGSDCRTVSGLEIREVPLQG